MKKILVVEDNPLNKRLFFDVLTAFGAHVIKAKTGKQALQKLQKTHPDLILMDIGLPDMTGVELFKCIRAQKNGKHIPIVATTAFCLPQEIATLYKLGFKKILLKPINIQALKELCE